ncbi:putative quorum-quenching lactonase YtnP [Variibacter gotjawalensis]|uniref:Putative quorum-quenching lactonase YtnP n=1 Tax=Variibacter gotjawalensis TaxID=1333996 RepID=A0A0S3PW64_9BRAD|nr:MBL fold metallo-hydrolase [Variibacter gotjawalensis]NIK46028.1 glyoxylase-like metal-dependent hydrolase (beta-lactamase superfamily II) [Variibacter gotjawalensis]RZS47946.1 glyoxylase-like metal-dependent hydrolase (beta-lactamase superfamily II) [Variibacter gotjawalensis]BAT60202.1 putative quorum-quenching lactonase YtnP [Variibacter gotjawalensis]
MLTRRSLIVGATLASTALPGRAAAPFAKKPGPAFYRFRLGEFEVTALYDGIWNRPLDEKFVRNVPFPDVQKALTDNFLPTDKLSLPFTAILVNTGKKLVLIDTGTGGQMSPTAGSLVDNLAAAGIKPSQIDAIAISHFHPDHINGLRTKDGKLVFTNAEIFVSKPEWKYWMEDNSATSVPESAKGVFLNANRVFKDLDKRVTRFSPGVEIVTGVISIPAFGHTPGHVAYVLASGNHSMLVLCDTTNHPWLFVRNPDWQPIFDMDGPQAVTFRRELLDRASADKMLVQGYHFPFPATGHIAKTNTGYEYVPVQWLPTL